MDEELLGENCHRCFDFFPFLLCAAFILVRASGSTILETPFALWPAQKNPRGRSLSTMDEEATSHSTSLTRCTRHRCPKSASIPNSESSCLLTKRECWNTGWASPASSSSRNMSTGNIKQTQTCMNLPNTKRIRPAWRFPPTGRKWPPLPPTGKSGSSAFSREN